MKIQYILIRLEGSSVPYFPNDSGALRSKIYSLIADFSRRYNRDGLAVETEYETIIDKFITLGVSGKVVVAKAEKITLIMKKY